MPTRKRLSIFKKENGATRAIAADSVLAEIQSPRGQGFVGLGQERPHPWDGERIVAYRRRVAREHQAAFARVERCRSAHASGQSLRNAMSQIFADSIAASSSPASYGETLREVRRRDPDTGHLVKEYLRRAACVAAATSAVGCHGWLALGLTGQVALRRKSLSPDGAAGGARGGSLCAAAKDPPRRRRPGDFCPFIRGGATKVN